MKKLVLDDVLQAISELGEASGFQIAKAVQKRRNTRSLLGYGTLYRALYVLKEQKKIKGRWMGGTVLYRLTTE